MDALSLYDLNALVRRGLEQCFPDVYWVEAELSDVRTNSSGHCYVEFVQKDLRTNNLVAKAKGTIWANVYRLLKPYFEEATGQTFVAGIKVLVQVAVNFHEGVLREPDVEIELDEYRSYNRSKRSGLLKSK